MDFGDVVATLEGLGLAGTWFWVLRRPVERIGNRRRLAVYALAISSLSVVLDLALTLILHFRPSPDDAIAGRAYLILFPLGVLAALFGLVSGLIAKGSPRLAAILWSLLMLMSAILSIFQMAAS